jgi:hypothetical protein
MSLIFTEQLDKPSQLRSKPSNLLRPIFGALYGFDATAVAPANTFTTLTIADTDTNAIGADDTITFTVQPSVEIAAGGTLTLTGMQGTQTADNASLTVGGAGAAIFGSSGSWTQSTGTLVLTVAGGQSLPTGSNTVITFTLTNSASVQSGKTVSVSSSTFATANATGTILNTVATYNVTTRDTEANILASTPSNPSGEVTNAYGTDTNDLYVYDGSAWYIYNDTPAFANQYSVSFDGTDDYATATLGSQVFDGDFAISFWFNASTSPQYLTLLQLGDSASYTDGWRLYRNFNQLQFWDGVGGYSLILQGGSISTSSWHHVAITRSGTNCTLYLNGNSIVTGTSSQVFTSTAFKISFTSFPFNGLIDEVALWDSALSASNVTSIYNSGVPNDISALSPVNWWRMGDNDGGTGTTITDQGSGSNDATLTNGPTFSTTVPS